MTKILSHGCFWALFLGVVLINLVLMYAPENFHFPLLVCWAALAIWAAIHLRRAYKSSGEVVGQGVLIGMVLAIALHQPSKFLLLHGYGSFDNVERAIAHSGDLDEGQICWGSHGPEACYE